MEYYIYRALRRSTFSILPQFSITGSFDIVVLDEWDRGYLVRVWKVLLT